MVHAAADAASQEKGEGMNAIGVFRSCFACRNGCPRQGSLVPSSMGLVKLEGSHKHFEAPAGHSLSGLEGFSHVWLLWAFHNYKSKKDRSPRVKPPRLGGQSLGVFACRSPKRPNKIGMSACRIERIDEENGTLLVSGHDLLDGTPILDLKPYIPQYDSFPDAKVPDWVNQPKSLNRAGVAASSVAVDFDDDVLKDLESLSLGSTLFRDAESMRETIRGVLAADPRSRTSKKHETQDYGFKLDNVYVSCSFRQNTENELSVVVTEVAPLQEST
ncbi:TsaA-like domain-containing protein [Chloropicon primus]|nr:hypothetical protein A3770_08p50830 [Chloropicon primus]UPR01786.1 TsaA-like domain-containing protein [Chloropicon primus]|eukprot:QDZ22565.1 hypothetical protein A3770_08p50830 [Chloropicon primus]